MAELTLREEHDGWVQEWYCAVPPPGVSYWVIRDDWLLPDLTVRRVFEVSYRPLKVVMHGE